MSRQDREKQLAICWVEEPMTGNRDGEEMEYDHTSLCLVDQTYGQGYVAQQLHIHNWDGFKFVPNVWIGAGKGNPLGAPTIETVKTESELKMWAAWNHMLRQACEWRELGEKGELEFDDFFHLEQEATNCRKGAKYFLESIGVQVDPAIAASQAGMGGEPLPVSSVFSFDAPPLFSLDDLYRENMHLVDALIPPWKMSRVPDFPGFENH